MISKNQIKHINALRLKKNREEGGLFIAEGVKVTLELLQGSAAVFEIFATASFLRANNTLLKNKNIKCNEVTAEELKLISVLTTPNEVLAVCKTPQYSIDYEKLPLQLSLVLDNIKDPGNLGTIIRIADWFGIKHIICSGETVDAFNPKVVQATMGSIVRVNLVYTDLPLFFEQVKKADANVPVYGALLSGESVYKLKLAKCGFIIIGSESHGISDALLPYITHKIKIPAFGAGENKAESLNAAVATSIICSEFKREL